MELKSFKGGQGKKICIDQALKKPIKLQEKKTMKKLKTKKYKTNNLKEKEFKNMKCTLKKMINEFSY
jgi:hypothetical protein